MSMVSVGEFMKVLMAGARPAHGPNGKTEASEDAKETGEVAAG